MPCSCHIDPPCGYCERSYECSGCQDVCHPDDRGKNESVNLFNEPIVYCDACVEQSAEDEANAEKV
jgi:hypothetical protein